MFTQQIVRKKESPDLIRAFFFVAITNSIITAYIILRGTRI